MIARRVEAADLRGDIRLEGAVAEDQHEERHEEQRLDRHHEMADRHQARADDDSTALAEDPVGKEPAEDRREIDEPGVEPVDLRRQRLHVERAEHAFERALEPDQAAHGAGLIGQQQIFRHVEHEQRAHPVIGEALPHFGGEQKRQRLRMAEQVGASGLRRISL